MIGFSPRHFRLFRVVADTMGAIWNSEEISYILDTLFLDFYCIDLIQIEKYLVKNLKLAFCYFLHRFLSILDYFWLFQSLTMGLIWNKKKFPTC